MSCTWDIGTVATITNVVHIDDNGGSLTVDGTVSISGTVPVTQSGGWSVTLGAALPAGANTIGAVSQNGTWTVGLSAGTNAIGKVIPEASASGTGTSAFRHTTLSSTAQQVKGSAGRVYGLHAFNPNASEIYLQLYDHASPTVGTTTPSRTYAVPGRGWLTLDLTIPQAYATAIHVAATATIGGSTAPGTGVLVDVEYV